MSLIKFGKEIPDYLKCDGGDISVTDSQHKSDGYGLCWKYRNGDKLVFDKDIGYISDVENNQDSRGNIFAMYVFGTGNDGVLRVEFSKSGTICAGFDIYLGFNGWRHIQISYDRDMEGVPCEGMNTFSITAYGNGIIILDEIVTCARGEIRHLAVCTQLPYIKNVIAPLGTDFNFKAKWKPKNISSRVIKDVATRYRQYVLNEYDTGKTANEIIAEADALQICNGEYGLCGKRVEHPGQRGLCSDTDGKNDEYIPLRKVTDLMCAIAVRYGKSGNKLLLERYIRILKYLITCGMAYGSTLGGLQILDYSMRPLYFSLAVMLDEPELKPFHNELCLALRWYTHFGKRGLCVGSDLEHSSTDDFFNLAPGIIVLALMLPDDEKKAWCLKSLSAWLDFNLQCTDGLIDMIKSDGCIYHHANHYPAYGNGALTGITPILYAFSGTEFDIGDTARENIRKTLLTLRFQSAGMMFATSFTARHPLKHNGIDLIPYRYYAKYELLRGNTDMASVYLRLAGDNVEKADEDILNSGAVAEKIPEGNITYPMACANVHRRDNWMLVTKGFSKYLWGCESYLNANHYGRYLTYGAIELYNDVENSGDRYYEDGYDWSRVAGATALKVPFDKLKSKIYNLDKKSGFEEMLISDQAFVGGNSLNGNGMFSMILTEHPKYNGSFCAYKSVFAKDDFILAIGSNISNISEYETETTLFQNRVLDGDAYVQRIGNKIYDNLGNIYYVKANTNVYINEGMQYSVGGEDDLPTRGEYAVAVIKHGINPNNATYAYGIGVNGAAEPDYEIIRQDERAHIVRIGNITYMAVFEPGTYGDVTTDIPLMVMMEKKKIGMSVALSNPDLSLYDMDEDQYDEYGNRREVSIYSRTWLGKRVGGKKANVNVCGTKLSMYMCGGDIVTVSV